MNNDAGNTAMYTVRQRGLRLVVLVALCVSAALGAVPISRAAAAGGSQFFPLTGHTVSGKFLDYWQTQGGLSLFGYPITDAQSEVDPITGRTFLTQWFERERFELHPEFAGTPYEVELGLLGRQVTLGRQSEVPFQPIAAFANTPDRIFFPQTGHSLAFGFKSFWTEHGSLAILGYPISEEFQEQNPSDGHIYTVQYFERARFEYHPANPLAYQVELGLLGDQLKQPTVNQQNVTLDVVASGSQTTIGTDQTALVPPATSSVDVTIHFPESIDQEPIQATLNQPGGETAWQITAPTIGSGNTYMLNVHTTNAPGTYFSVEVVHGTGHRAIRFGVQVNNALPNLPPLVANWMDPVALLNSYYNAINRQEYLRAYSYWENPGAPNTAPANFNDFVNGYASTAHVDVTTGSFVGDPGAGNIYFAIPTVLAAAQANGSMQRFYGCYLLHRVNVEIGNTIPPNPVGLRAARIFAAPANADPTALMSQAQAFVQAGQCTQ